MSIQTIVYLTWLEKCLNSRKEVKNVSFLLSTIHAIINLIRISKNFNQFLGNLALISHVIVSKLVHTFEDVISWLGKIFLYCEKADLEADTMLISLYKYILCTITNKVEVLCPDFSI